MSVTKQTKDYIIKAIFGKTVVPRGLSELNHYFRTYGSIDFRQESQADGSIILVSENFRYGSIVAHAKHQDDLDANVTDAILTAFDVPSSYAKEANVKRVGKKEYAFA